MTGHIREAKSSFLKTNPLYRSRKKLIFAMRSKQTQKNRHFPPPDSHATLQGRQPESQ